MYIYIYSKCTYDFKIVILYLYAVSSSIRRICQCDNFYALYNIIIPDPYMISIKINYHQILLFKLFSITCNIIRHEQCSQ